MEYSVQQSSPVVTVIVTNNVTSLSSETRFNKDLTIGALKRKLEMMTGAMSSDMKLEIFGRDDRKVCDLNNDNALLGSFPIDDGMRLHVTGSNCVEFEDVSTVKKFELSDSEYAKKKDSVRAFKQQMKLGQFKEGAGDEGKKHSHDDNKVDHINIGDRCQVEVTGQPHKRGSVRFVGETSFKPGKWVGIEYDEPLGKNDGSVEGKRYFQCKPKYGAFVRPNQVTVGNFPELGIDEEM